MLTTDDLARLRGLLAQHSELVRIKDSLEYLSAYGKWDAAAGTFLADHGEELARVYEAVLAAPEVDLRERNVPGAYSDEPTLTVEAELTYADQRALDGTVVRLVPLATAKGGE